ncbi:IS1595 family transposase [Dyella agri]|uniref:IS1595 family transposase n=1 Tax=Dyella agri TaxID=1926869 RepID=A0ABW8KKK5_9GAMM
MTQHYLHSKESRNFARKINSLTNDEAEQWLASARWGATDKQGCPACGLFRKHYRRAKTRRWRCASCSREFSVTSGTPFHGRKLPFVDMIRLFAAFENGAKGQSLLEASRRVGCTPKTAQVFFGKIREWMVHAMDLCPLGGAFTVHMDGGYFGGKPRKPNRRARIPRRALEVRFGKKAPKNQNQPWIEAGMTYQNWCKRARKRVVISLCESAGHRMGSGRVMAFVCSGENEAEVTRLAKNFLSPDARVMTDESSAYSTLGALVAEHYTVSHANEFSTSEGVSDNMCETLFSRFRRSEYGTLHGFRPKYLQDYTCEFVWRENHRKHAQDKRFRILMIGMMTAPTSRWWAGYWQGRCRREEIGLDYFLARLPSTK